MSQQSSSSKVSNNQPQENPFVEYKEQLIRVYEILSNVDLRQSSGYEIEYSQRLIADILRTLRNVDTSKYRSIRSREILSSYLKELKIEFQVAIYIQFLLENDEVTIADKVTCGREYYNSINICQEYIDKILSQFLI